MMNTPSNCPECGAELPPDAPQGLCPRCLSAAAFAPGDRIQYFGNYELVSEIALGGMGIVWKARQISLNRTVALKMIRGGILATAEDVRRFHVEAEAAASLQHPHIVAIHEIGECEGEHYFSMDFVDGKNLEEFCDGRALPPEQAARLLARVAEAVEFAHLRGIVHRDLKPQNVLIDKNGEPRLTDFGLAKLMNLDTGLTQTGAIVGSPNYMAPEQARGAHAEVGPRSDIYALGAVLFYMLTGQPPFRADSPLETVRRVADTEPTPPRRLNAAVPRDLETICLKCLEKDAVRRYTTAQEVADELGRFLRHEPIRARPLGIAGRTAKLCRRRPVVMALAAVNAVALLAICVSTFIFSDRLHKTRAALTDVEARAMLAEQRLEQPPAATDKFVPKISSGAGLPTFLANGSFEEGPTGAWPSHWGMSTAHRADGWRARVVEEDVAEGRRCALIEHRGSDAPKSIGSLAQALDATAYRGQRLRFAAQLRHRGPAGTQTQLWLRIDAGDGKMLFLDNSHERPATEDAWRKFEIVADVPQNAGQIVVGFFVNGGGASGKMDDARILAAATPPASGLRSPAPNGPILTNGDFEQGEAGTFPIGWKLLPAAMQDGWTARLVREGAFAGRQCLAVERTNAAAPTTIGSLGGYIPAADFRGRKVRFSAQLRHQGPPGTETELWLRIDGPDGPLFLDNDRPVVADNWQKVAIEADVPMAARGIVFGLYVNGGASGKMDEAKFEDLGPAATSGPGR